MIKQKLQVSAGQAPLPSTTGCATIYLLDWPQIVYSDNPQKDAVELLGRIDYPNLVLSASQVRGLG